MIGNDRLKQLLSLVTEFEKLDASIANSLKNGDWDVLIQAWHKKKEIKRFLSECNPLSVERGLGNKLKRIRDNYGYTIDRVFKAMSSNTGEPIS